jgi:hypothetical protein
LTVYGIGHPQNAATSCDHEHLSYDRAQWVLMYSLIAAHVAFDWNTGWTSTGRYWSTSRVRLASGSLLGQSQPLRYSFMLLIISNGYIYQLIMSFATMEQSSYMFRIAILPAILAFVCRHDKDRKCDRFTTTRGYAVW